MAHALMLLHCVLVAMRLKCVFLKEVSAYATGTFLVPSLAPSFASPFVFPIHPPTSSPQGIEKKRSALGPAEKGVVARHEAGHALLGAAVAKVLPDQRVVQVGAVTALRESSPPSPPLPPTSLSDWEAMCSDCQLWQEQDGFSVFANSEC